MKKLIITFFIILFFPISVFAYSKYVIPGGQSIGININSNGVLVVGYYKVNNTYINKNIHISDKIIKVNNISISDINEFLGSLNKNKDKSINIELIRNNKIINTELKLIRDGNEITTGLYVKDSIIGIGTLTYIDPVSKIYGSLGHEITLDNMNTRVEIKEGNIFESIVTGITRSKNGYVGSKNARIEFSKELGNIEQNISTGVYGHYTSSLSNNTILVGGFDDIMKKEAYILTVNKDKNIKKYKIKIMDKFENKKDTSKAFSFQIVDKELLNQTGGIVQGMSGSPIIQDDKIIGAVTNVVIDDVKMGYGISIITMLEDGDNLVK